MKLSPHARIRLESFEELVNDKSYGKKRAIDGLKVWKFSQKHRLTDHDNFMIDYHIRRYSK